MAPQPPPYVTGSQMRLPENVGGVVVVSYLPVPYITLPGGEILLIVKVKPPTFELPPPVAVHIPPLHTSIAEECHLCVPSLAAVHAEVSSPG